MRAIERITRGMDASDHAGVLGGDLGLSRLGRLPSGVVDDAQLWHLGDDPVRFRIEPGHTAACAGILDEPLPIPHQSTDIELVVHQARAALGVTAHRRPAPGPAARAGDTFGVEPLGDAAGRNAACELSEDAPHHLGLVRIDGAFATDGLAFTVQPPHDIIAIADPAAGLALLDPAPEAAMSLLGQVL
nr:hypothetical protein [Brevundimonas nasdae]